MSKAHVPQRYRAEVDNRVREHEKVTHRQDRKTKREGSTRRATGVSKLLGDVLRQTDPQQFAVVTSEEAQQSAHSEVVGGQSSSPVYSTAYAEAFRPDDDGRPDPLFMEPCRVDISFVEDSGETVSRKRVTVNVPVDVIDRNVPDSVDVDVSAIDLPDGWELSARQNHKVVAKVTGAKPDNLIARARVTVSPKSSPVPAKPTTNAPARISGATRDVSSTVTRRVEYVYGDDVVHEYVESFTFTGTARGDEVTWRTDRHVFAAVQQPHDPMYVVDQAAPDVTVTPNDEGEVKQVVVLSSRYTTEPVEHHITVAVELLIGTARYSRDPYTVTVEVPVVNDVNGSGESVSDPEGYIARHISDIVAENDGLEVTGSRYDDVTDTVHVTAVPPTRDNLLYPPREDEVVDADEDDDIYAIDVYPAGFISHCTKDTFDPVDKRELDLFTDLANRVNHMVVEKINQARREHDLSDLAVVNIPPPPAVMGASPTLSQLAWEWAVDAMLKKHIGRTRELSKVIESTGLSYGSEILIPPQAYADGLPFSVMVDKLVGRLDSLVGRPMSIMSEDVAYVVVAPLVRYIKSTGNNVSASMSIVALRP